MRASTTNLPLATTFLTPGLRLAVGLSGGADSVALLRTMAERSRELGLVLHVAHLHHGLRGAEADADRDFCSRLAGNLGLPFHQSIVDTAAAARPDPATGKPVETIEEAARRLRYRWFRTLMFDIPLDAIATAHTRDDQAETVLAKFLRGAWSEGLSGIHPVVGFPEGRILRPLLAASRADIEAYLHALGQDWREDSSNRHLTFTRNRIRHELLPLLETWNPRLREHLAQMAEIAREEEAWWEGEVARVAAQIVLPGRPVRGGGRAAAEGLAIETARLSELPVALQRRVLRHAAERLGSALDFKATESLRNLALTGRAGQKCALEGLQAERTHRELRLSPGDEPPDARPGLAYAIDIPGETTAPEWGIRLRIATTGSDSEKPPAARSSIPALAGFAKTHDQPGSVTGHDLSRAATVAESTGALQAAEKRGSEGGGGFIPRTTPNELRGFSPGPDTNSPLVRGLSATPLAPEGRPSPHPRQAILRPWKPGDRVRLRHSAAPRKVKEVLERMHVTGSARASWPVLELDGRIIWMQGAQLHPEPGISLSVTPLEAAQTGCPGEPNPHRPAPAP